MTAPADPRRGRHRPRFTSRAAVLAIVVCAIAMSLAYPVREYLSQRRQIAELTVAREQIDAQLRRLAAQQRELRSPAYIEQQARDKLHMCLPTQTCYVVVGVGHHSARAAGSAAHPAGSPWYRRVWSSVQQADQVPRAASRTSR
ncbi:MAG: FtsB family cell division protein [Streptosporangiaceae bacterium]